MKLHYHAIGDGYPIILIHGLFGSGDNLGLISRALKDKYKVINVDLRNHGLSPHSDQFTYQQMAQDVLDMIDELSIDHFAVIGHSMGGKVAMSLTELHLIALIIWLFLIFHLLRIVNIVTKMSLLVYVKSVTT